MTQCFRLQPCNTNFMIYTYTKFCMATMLLLYILREGGGGAAVWCTYWQEHATLQDATTCDAYVSLS